MSAAIGVVLVDGRRLRPGRRLAPLIESDGDITVLGETPPRQALATMQRLDPDVALVRLPDLDDHEAVEVTDVLVAIRQISSIHPTPMLIIEGSTGKHRNTMAALVAGALEALPDPTSVDDAAALRSRVRALQKLSLSNRYRRRERRPVERHVPVVGVGASVGGPPALAAILGGLGGLRAAVLIVQHLQAAYMGGFVEWMQRASSLPVAIAEDGAMVRPGTALIAPADRHLRIHRDGHLSLDAEPVSIHRPSIDVLLTSIAECRARTAVGVLLTGMGEDGVAGLLKLRQAGSMTIAQDEASSSIFGMPRAAQRAGAVRQVLPLQQIAAAIARAVAGIPV